MSRYSIFGRGMSPGVIPWGQCTSVEVLMKWLWLN
nr:MAG TPA: hypothetical protein [Caudoviricetes sp.]